METTLIIKGMQCSNCVSHVTRRLQQTPGVRTATVKLKEGKALVSFDEAKTDRQTLVAAVEKMGYAVQ